MDDNVPRAGYRTMFGSAATIYEDTPFWMEDHALANAKAHLLEYFKNLGPQDRVALS